MLELAAAIREARKQQGLSQHELAERAQVSRSIIANLERQQLGELGIIKLLRILHALELDLRLTALNLSRPTLEDLQAEEAKGAK